jgi:iron complex transport system permease protein
MESMPRIWAPAILFGRVVLLGVCSLAAVGIGMVQISPGQVLAIMAKQGGLTLPWPFGTQHEAVLLAIRLPRVALGGCIGAGLAVAGAAMQGLFRNPLADPGLVGVSSGAALAAVLVIVLSATVLRGLAYGLGPFTLPLAAFVGGLVTTLVVYHLSRVASRTVVATMLLAGIAVNALAGAGTGVLTFAATDAELRNITFWSLGSLGGATWTTVGAAVPCIVPAVVLLIRRAMVLNVFLLGESEASHLGVHVERVKRLVILLVALVVGAAVAVSGIIGFVGLVVPHVLRLAVGPDHRYVLPGSALLGASLLLGADLVARTLVAPAELPLGMVTAAIGAPFFLWLLLRQRRQWRL